MKLFIDDIRTPPDDTWHICRDVFSSIRALDMFYEDVEYDLKINGEECVILKEEAIMFYLKSSP